MKYQIIITETLKRFIEVEAENEIDAQEMVQGEYECGEIILDSDDYFDTEFETREII